MTMAGIFATIGDKLGLRGGGDKVQYLLAGTLVLVILISLVAAISSFTGGGRDKGPNEFHYYDVVTGEEFVLSRDQMMEQSKMEGPGGPEGMPGGMMPGMPGMRVINPSTGERNGIPMMQCPACKKWFVTEAMKSADPQAMMMMDMGPSICTHCGVNITEYYREQSKNRKKKK